MVLPFYGAMEAAPGGRDSNYYVIPGTAYSSEEYKRREAERKTIEEEAAKYGIDRQQLERLAGFANKQMPQSVTSASYGALSELDKLNPYGYYRWTGDAPNFTGTWQEFSDYRDPNSSEAFYQRTLQYRPLGQRYSQVGSWDYLKSQAVATGKEEYDKWRANQWGYEPPSFITQPTEESIQNLEILQKQAEKGDIDSKQFLDEYITKEDTLIARNQGPSTPVKYDEQMKQLVPNPGAGRPGEVRLKNPPPFALGPRGETTIAQAGPRGMDRAPGTYHPSGVILPLITPGSRFSDREGYMIKDPFKNSPQTGPGLSKEKEDFDPYQAQLASAAAKEYRQRGQVEDPFRSGAFG
jgi:hypothetical protein